MSTYMLELPARQTGTAQWAAVAFVASYSSPGTRQAYSTQLRLWFDWCDRHGLEPLKDICRPHVELYARELEARGLAPATIALKLVVVTGWYRYCVEEQLIEHSPAACTSADPRCPRSPRGSGWTALNSGRSWSRRACRAATTTYWPACSHSTHCGSRRPAVRTWLTLRWPTVTACCASSARATSRLIPLAPRTARAIDAAVGERTSGPLLAQADGSRLDRHAAGRIVRRLARKAGIDKPISPHSLRHAAITAALDAGCSLRDGQDFARHADPRQTRRYDRARGALDRNPTYIVATYLAGATGAR